MTEKELLAKFANYMVANNHKDPLIYKLASDIIRRDGLVYSAHRKLSDIYGDAKHASGWHHARLDDAFRACMHTCVPTPRDIEIQKSVNESMMRDYWECSALGYNTD